MGMGTSVSTAVSERTAVVIEDYMFDASTAGELKPEESPKDFHDTWDLDGTDFTPEASPDDEGYWDDFENIVLNGNYEELGSELVTNGDFSTSGTITTTSHSLGWRIGGSGDGGSSIVNNQLFLERPIGEDHDEGRVYATDGSSSFNVKPSNHQGKTFRLQLDIVSSTGSPTLQYFTGGAYANLPDNTTGTKVVYFTSDNTQFFVLKMVTEGATMTIDNVSLKQVDPNDRWQLQSSGNSSSSITDKLTISVDNGDFASARQALSLSNGNTYELSFDLTSNNSNTSIAIRDDDGAAGGLTETVSLNFTGTQTKSFIFTANANSDAFFTKRQSGSGTYTYSIDNVIVKEYAITPLDV